MIRKNHTERTMFPCLRTARRFLPFHHRENTLSLSPLGTDTWEADCTPYAWKRVWAPYFDLSVSYKSLRRSIPAKIISQAAAEYGKGIRILRQDPFEMLITFIISQRKSIPAIRSSVEKLCLAAGKEITKNGRTFYTFPSPSALGKLSVNELKTVLSGTGPPIFMPQPA